ncbi:MAG TPA: sugar ABC transporter substrate-binding protein [Chthoniobacterales bacterium]|jgi:multiple sugar transport system substrate-binding protein|nr:sugar ABC transporter substrate-binding protein [Chthoniobacterales bacterium]
MYRLRNLLFAGLTLAAVSAHAATEITYWLWDALQLPAYQAAAAAFEKANPDIKVKITQTAWGDYWTTLSTGFVSGTAPDVFTDHLARYPEFVANELLVDIGPLIKKDKVPTDVYLGGLYDLWGKGGKQYGLPKDWDTIALIYNKAMLEKAGVDPKELNDLTWNPKDGGTFGQLIAKLSIDEAGNNGLSPNFNPKKVKQYGLLIDGAPDGFGQVEWSHFAVSNGFKFHDGPWAKGFHYDDPKLAETLQWLADTMKKGFIVPAKDARQLGANGLFAAGKGAMALTGSWTINWYSDNAKFDKGFAPLPKGPDGRKSMFNGLADSIWVGSKHKDEAWKWVKFLGSEEGQKIIAGYGVVFPAIRSDAELAEQVMSKKGVDVSAFLAEATDPQGTFLFPIADHAADVLRITKVGLDAVLLNGANAASTFKKVNKDVNELFD